MQNGVALVKKVFPEGNKQLWLYDTHDGSRKEIPRSWTEADGDIVGAHFKSDGSIEYFQNFVRHTYQPGEQWPMRYEDQTLNWYGSVEESYQIVGDRTAWVDADNGLHISLTPSEADEVIHLGVAAHGKYWLESGRIFYGFADQSKLGQVYQFASEQTRFFPFAIAHAISDVVVGTDNQNHIWFNNSVTEKTIKVGYGVRPAVADSMHVYWQGSNGIYEATIDPTQKSTPNKLVAGAKVKAADSVRVYVLGQDNKLHWLVSQAVAYEIYGERWNKNIIVVAPNVLFNYMMGDSLQNERDLQNIIK